MEQFGGGGKSYTGVKVSGISPFLPIICTFLFTGETRMNRIRHNNQNGFNLIEAAIVLSIVGIVIAGVFAAWGTVTSQQRVRKATDMTTMVVQQVRTTYATRTSLESATGAAFTSALINAELIPSSWLSGTNVMNPWGGVLLVTPETLSSNSAMNISFSALTTEDCIKLANQVIINGRTQGLVQVDGTAITNTSTYGALSGICGSATLSLHFMLKNN
jgi:prepilin-type N-terminal cleavage/methylation domain-containing protein